MLQQRLRDYAMLETEHLMQMGMGLIQAPWPVTVQTFRRFDSDLGNLRQVLGRCLADRDAEAGLRLCTVMGPVWIVRGSFAEGAEWYDSFFGLDSPVAPVPAAVLGPAIVGRAQLALASDPVQAQVRAAEGLRLCREAGADFWTATALNLLTEVALHAGRGGEAADLADETLAVARQAGDRWNEGYALGTMAAAAGQRGDLAGAQRLGEAALAVMRGIDQQWGAARTLLGLGDLARLTGDAYAAGRRYEEALVILREVNARPEIARCLAGLGRIAMDQGEIAVGRQHLTRSIELSRSTGSRIGTIRGVEAFAALAVAEGHPERAVRLAAAAAALRMAAHLPPRPAAWADRYLAAARDLGEDEVGRLWEQGSGLDASSAVELALEGGPQAATESASAAPSAGRLATPGGLTPRELEIVALIAKGHSNRAIGEELVISPATAARHVANIMLKLGFSSRAQIAAWAVRESGGAADGSPA
jgi:DNA-binding CsgD family transcriptional regulator